MVRTALPVSADRVALPTVAGRVAPEDYLVEPHRSEFLDVRRREAIPPGVATGARACHRISGAEEVKLLTRLCTANMGAFHLERDILAERARVHDRPYNDLEDLDAGGFFAVKHKPTSDRLIYDRRKRNARERRLGWSRLPSGVQWTQAVIGDDEFMRGSADDLRVWFYCLKAAPHGHVYNVVGKSWTCRDLKAANLPVPPGARDGEPCRFCLQVQGMGDLNAVDVAQLVHEGILRRHDALPPACQLAYDATVPQSKVWVAVYVDDKVVS